MAGANTQQYGIKNWRIYREPIDGETVQLTYQDILDRLEPNDAEDGTKLGTFYGGLITSVTSDENKSYNGPWYISYTINNDKVSYSADRIFTKNEIDLEFGYVLESPQYTKPQMTVQFVIPNTYNATTGEYELTPVIDEETVYVDAEIGTEYNPAFKLNWPVRTLENENGTRSAYSPNEITQEIPNELLGYSYGVEAIKYKIAGRSQSASFNDNIIRNPLKWHGIDEKQYEIITDINIDYLPASYMYYPQFYDKGRYEISYGDGETKWFGAGTYIPKTTKMSVNCKYKYFWGLVNDDNTPGNSGSINDYNLSYGLLNFSNITDGTVTSFKVGDNNNYNKFIILYPNNFTLGNFNENIQIQLENPDGSYFDLVCDIRKLIYVPAEQLAPYHRPDNGIMDNYCMCVLELEYPIGNKNSVISFRIVPVN